MTALSKQKYQPKKKNQRGFSIVELSIVLTVVALMAASALSAASSRLEHAHSKATQKKMAYIMETVEKFVNTNGYLPCPADNNEPVTSVNFGDGVGTGGAGGAPDCSVANDSIVVGSGTVLMGGLPVKQLGLALSAALDGWGRRFTYVVTDSLTYTDTGFSLGWADPNTIGQISIFSAGATIMTTDAAVLLISHGSDGHGAWKGTFPAGTTNTRLDKGSTALVDDDEEENVEGGAGGCTSCTTAGGGGGSCGTCGATMDSVFIQHFRTSTFDDLLDYRLKWHFDTP